MGEEKHIPPMPVYRKPKKQSLGKNTIIKSCECCGKDMAIPLCRQEGNKRGQGEQKFCSRACYDFVRQNNVELVCKICGEKFVALKSDVEREDRVLGVKVCSKECLRELKAHRVKVNTMDGMWAKVIKNRAGWKCEYCGGVKKLNAHHIYSRGVWSVRWDLDNGMCLCVRHHILGAKSAHKSPLLFADWIREQRGDVWNKRLLEKVKLDRKPDKVWEYFNLLHEIEVYEGLDNPKNFDIRDWDWGVAPRSSIIECF